MFKKPLKIKIDRNLTQPKVSVLKLVLTVSKAWLTVDMLLKAKIS